MTKEEIIALNKEFCRELENKYLNKIVYSEKLGKGTIVRITNAIKHDNTAYLIIIFDNETNERLFKFPSCFQEKYLSLDAPKVASEKSWKEKEIDKEKEYLEEIKHICDKEVERDVKAAPVSIDLYIAGDDEYDPQAIQDNIANETRKSLWRDIGSSPFFASIDSKNTGLFYIGKHQIQDNSSTYVVRWTDKRCNLYYNYQMLLGNKDYGLRLVRDHDIRFRRYLDFVDKFNVSSNSDAGGINIEKLTDSYLLKLLEHSRQNKKTHEIIQTIQSNQYQIVSDISSRNILVKGCAGSGKTMVLFHRIAYLAFNDENFKSNQHCIISTNKLLNIEAKELSKELDISNVQNKSIYEFYKLVLKDFVKDNNCAVVIDDQYDDRVSNPKFYKEAFLNEVCSNINFIINKGLSGKKYISQKKKKLVAEWNLILGSNIEENENGFEYITNHFYNTDSEYFGQYTQIEDILSEIRLPNVEAAIEETETNKTSILNLLKTHFAEKVSKEAKLDLNIESVQQLKTSIDNYFGTVLAKFGDRISNTNSNIHGDPRIILFYDYINDRKNIDNMLEHITNIVKKANQSSDGYDALEQAILMNFRELFFEQSNVECTKQESLKVIDAQIMKHQSYEDQSMSWFDTNKFFYHPYLALLYDVMKHRQIIHYIINACNDVPFENAKKAMQYEKYSYLIEILKPYCNDKTVLELNNAAFEQLLKYIDGQQEKEPLFCKNTLMPTVLADYYDHLYFEKNIETPIYQFAKMPRQNFYVSKNENAKQFVYKYLDSFFENDKCIMTQDGNAILKTEPNVLTFLDSVNSQNAEVNSIFDERVKGNKYLIGLLDKILLQKEFDNLYCFINKGQYGCLLIDMIDYVVDGKIDDYDKAFLYAFAINKFASLTIPFKRVYIDEYQNYSKTELSLIRSLCPDAKIDLFGDSEQKIESKGLLNDTELPFTVQKTYSLNVNYRNSKEICEYLNKEYGKQMMSIGIAGSLTFINVNEPIDLKNSEENDRTVVIVKNIDMIDKLKFADDKETNLVSSNSGSIIKNKINVCSIFDVRGLEFEKVYLFEKDMSKNEKYLGASRALRDLVIIR